MRRAARVDHNQSEIIAAFRNMGASVYPTHTMGSGFPDCVVGMYGISVLVEIKRGDLPPSKRKLTPDEKMFFDSWRGAAVIVSSNDDVIELIGRMAAQGRGIGR